MTTDSRPAILRFVERVNAHRERVAAIGGGPDPLDPEPPDQRPAGPAVAALTPEVAERLDRAARRARAHYGGPVGGLVEREIRAYLEFGHRFGPDGLVTELAGQILAADAAGTGPGPIPVAPDPG